MNFLQGNEIIDILSKKAEEKKKMSLERLVLLGILGGAFIALGYLAYVRVVGNTPENYANIGAFIGASIFPIGLISIYLLGLELVTGNTMTMTLGYLDRRVSLLDVIFNWVVVALANVIGAVIIAYLFGHVVGLTEGTYTESVVKIAESKVNVSYLSMIISGIGGNVFVGVAVWIATSAKNLSGKIFGLWFPVMVFVLIGLQHSIANAFIIPAAMFTGQSSITVFQFMMNFINVFIGNAIGGALILAVPAFISNRKCNSLGSCEIPYSNK